MSFWKIPDDLDRLDYNHNRIRQVMNGVNEFKFAAIIRINIIDRSNSSYKEIFIHYKEKFKNENKH